jgi:hypothetical protein
MSSPAIGVASDVKRPATWRYFAGAVIAFPFVCLLWMMLDFRVLHPELAKVSVETTMDRMRWFSVPLVLVILLFGGNWL